VKRGKNDAADAEALCEAVTRPSMRIPVKATTLSGAWRPRDPVDDDRGGARA